MTKVPQLMSDRPRMVANTGKFIVRCLHGNNPYGVLSGDTIVEDVDGELATVFSTLNEADDAAAVADARGGKFRNVALRHQSVHLVDDLNGPRIYRAA